MQIPVAPQCVTSASPGTAAHSVTSAALASTNPLEPVFHATAVGIPSCVTPTPATAYTASTTPLGPSASFVLLDL